VRILSFTGGAGNMYCGSCLRDNALASALLARGHDVVLTPVYTPTRTDERNVSHRRVAFGGISVFLEQHSSLFRHTPRILDRVWDAEWVIKMASSRQIKVDPRSLGEMTVSMLRGERGFQRKEIVKLLDWLKRERPFDVINLPYTLLIGLAEPLRRALKTPICCTLQGEDLFLDGLGEPWRTQSLDLIRAGSEHVNLFLPVSRYYYDYMPGYLGIPREKMRLVPLGINLDGYAPRGPSPRGPRPRKKGPFTIGYFARVAPEKGLHVLADAYRRLRARPGLGESRLVAAGYLAREHRAYLDGILANLRKWGLADQFEYRGELDRGQKIEYLQSLDVLSVPATYEEPKGMFLLEAMANGVPVVQPRRGAFPEVVETTGGGLIVEADNPEAMVDAWLELWKNPERAAALGAAGAAGVRQHYSVDRMAETVEQVYRELIDATGSENRRGLRAHG
jgi:glycosyltransferase involved in cell wall biosynthesis